MIDKPQVVQVGAQEYQKHLKHLMHPKHLKHLMHPKPLSHPKPPR